MHMLPIYLGYVHDKYHFKTAMVKFEVRVVELLSY